LIGWSVITTLQPPNTRMPSGWLIPFKFRLQLKEMPVMASTITKAQFLQLNQTTELQRESMHWKKKKIPNFCMDNNNRFWISCGIDYYIQIAFKISLSIHDCHSHWKKKKEEKKIRWRRRRRQHFVFLGSSLFVISPKKFTLCVVVFQRHLSCGEESFRARRVFQNQESPLQLECSRYDSSVVETQLS
jgi:hypothetical protein